MIATCPNGISLAHAFLFLCYYFTDCLLLFCVKINYFHFHCHYSAINSPADCDSLQYDLSNVYKWAESNNMKFNSIKFQYINFTVSPQCNTSNVYVSADSNLIDHTVKDLGVLMSSDCMFDDHICQVTKKCSPVK